MEDSNEITRFVKASLEYEHGSQDNIFGWSDYSHRIHNPRHIAKSIDPTDRLT